MHFHVGRMRFFHKAFLLLVTYSICTCAEPRKASAEDLEQYTIDYAVFYTPEARANEEDGSVAAMDARIARAFEGANEIFRESKTGVQLRLVATRQLSINNSAIALDTVTSELPSLPEVLDTVKTSKADSFAVIVEQMSPGAYAGIPISRNQARTGGSTFFGRRNFSGFTFAHETGHTLGAFHDRPADLSVTSDSTPENPFGNHFIGASGQHWRTVMSVKVNSLLAPPGQTIPTVQCNRFSSPDVIWDGVVTGVAEKYDVVAMIRYYAPLVSQAGELRNPPSGGENGENPPTEGGLPIVPTPIPNNENEEPPMEELTPTISLRGKPTRSGQNVAIRGKCLYSNDNSAAVGKKLELGFRSAGKVTVVKRSICNAKGVVSFSLNKKAYRRGLEILYRNHPSIRVRVPFDKNLVKK